MSAIYRDPSSQPRHLVSRQVESLTYDGDPNICITTNTGCHAGRRRR